ncbi:hypothetical protein SUGI_0364420 [Cryptomeria japonica]|nr:hypothetical protein SUGI_0364420 [Cryptomeria japonica]
MLVKTLQRKVNVLIAFCSNVGKNMVSLRVTYNKGHVEVSSNHIVPVICGNLLHHAPEQAKVLTVICFPSQNPVNACYGLKQNLVEAALDGEWEDA